jgi:thymidylate kinase
LRESNVTYCHWKSNESLGGAVTGEQDLDLLIAREDARVTVEILARLGFVLARPSRDRQLPGILDYYATDEAAGRIIHVHAHFQLVVGDDMTKNFHLPVEGPYLESRTTGGPLPTPSIEWEYLVFVIRMIVKHSPWDAQLARKGKLAPSERRELADLSARVDEQKVADLRSRYLPMIDQALFDRCVAAANGSLNRLDRMFVARRLLRAIDSLGRSGRTVDTILRVWRRTLRRLRRRSERHVPGKRPDVGGAIVAVVGGDGSGKSSTVEALVEHLSSDFAVRRVHMGKPPWTRTSKIIRRQMRRARRFGLFQATKLDPWTDFSQRPFPGYGYLIWHLLIARDRYQQYRQARRASGRGEVIVSDRWPLAPLRIMDGPRLQSIPRAGSSLLAKKLCDRELAYYQAILPPDLVIVLRVSPEVAARRRTEDPAEFVQKRAAEVWDADWTGIPALVIDADQALELVVAQARRAIWSRL